MPPPKIYLFIQATKIFVWAFSEYLLLLFFLILNYSSIYFIHLKICSRKGLKINFFMGPKIIVIKFSEIIVKIVSFFISTFSAFWKWEAPGVVGDIFEADIDRGSFGEPPFDQKFLVGQVVPIRGALHPIDEREGGGFPIENLRHFTLKNSLVDDSLYAHVLFLTHKQQPHVQNWHRSNTARGLVGYERKQSRYHCSSCDSRCERKMLYFEYCH